MSTAVATLILPYLMWQIAQLRLVEMDSLLGKLSLQSLYIILAERFILN
jgi:hypothetical protein